MREIALLTKTVFVCFFFAASTTAGIGGRLRKGSCYKIVDGPFKSDKYIWYQLTHRCWNEVQCIL